MRYKIIPSERGYLNESPYVPKRLVDSYGTVLFTEVQLSSAVMAKVCVALNKAYSDGEEYGYEDAKSYYDSPNASFHD